MWDYQNCKNQYHTQEDLLVHMAEEHSGVAHCQAPLLLRLQGLHRSQMELAVSNRKKTRRQNFKEGWLMKELKKCKQGASPEIASAGCVKDLDWKIERCYWLSKQYKGVLKSHPDRQYQMMFGAQGGELGCFAWRMYNPDAAQQERVAAMALDVNW